MLNRIEQAPSRSPLPIVDPTLYAQFDPDVNGILIPDPNNGGGSILLPNAGQLSIQSAGNEIGRLVFEVPPNTESWRWSSTTAFPLDFSLRYMGGQNTVPIAHSMQVFPHDVFGPAAPRVVNPGSDRFWLMVRGETQIGHLILRRAAGALTGLEWYAEPTALSPQNRFKKLGPGESIDFRQCVGHSSTPRVLHRLLQQPE